MSGTSERTKANAQPATAQMMPGITTMLRRPMRSPSLPPMGVMMLTPRLAKMVKRLT